MAMEADGEMGARMGRSAALRALRARNALISISLLR